MHAFESYAINVLKELPCKNIDKFHFSIFPTFLFINARENITEFLIGYQSQI